MKYKKYLNDVLNDDKSSKLNFEVDDRIHYVYRVTDLEDKTHYYGSRTCKKKNIDIDFWHYCTSSYKKKLIKLNKERFKVKILRKDFSSRALANIYEAFLHQRFNVKVHSSFWNKSNQTPFGFDTTGNKEISKKISEARKGSILSDEHKNKISAAMKGVPIGPNSESHNKKVSESKNKIIFKDGIETTSAIEGGKKCSKTKQSEEWKNTVGKETTKKWRDSYMGKSTEVAIKVANSKREKSKKYNLIHINTGLVKENIILGDARKMSQSLPNFIGRENYFGKSKTSYNRAIKFGNEELIGLYLEEIIN